MIGTVCTGVGQDMIGTVCTGVGHGVCLGLFVRKLDKTCDWDCLYGSGTRCVIGTVCAGVGQDM